MTENVLQKCRTLFESGDLEGAHQLASRVMSEAPDCGEAYYYLGLIAYRRGDPVGALEQLCKAATLCPHHAEIQNHYGNALREHGRYEEALEQYKIAAGLRSGYAAPLYNMGLLQVARGDAEAAAVFLEKSLEIDPDFTPARSCLGTIRLEQDNYSAAENLLRTVLDKFPNNLETLNNLSLALIRLKRCDEALELCQRGISLAPHSADICNVAGMALRELGRLQEAITHYRKALALNPDNPVVLSNLGCALRDAGNVPESISLLQSALRLKPDYALAWHNLGISLRELGRLDESIEAYQRAIEIRPLFSAAYNDLGDAQTARGDVENAVVSFRKALDIEPGFVVAYSNMLLTMQYLPDISPGELYEASRGYEKLCPGLSPRTVVVNTEPDRPLRIGYVSPDFRRHSVSYFLKSVFENKSAEFSINCYSDVLTPDAHTDYYRSHADRWRTICGLSHEQVANLIRDDRIDILVDLAGHTGQRIPLFALKPAPVQVTWLGYPDTTGLEAVDYRFSDELADPVGESDAFCSEKIYRLPGGFLCYTAPEDAPEVIVPLSRSKDRVTFGSFNNIAKITPQVVALWSKLLLHVPGARLIIKNHSLADKNVRDRYESLFLKNGITRDRVELRPWIKETGSHLAVYGEIDIALDTFPYNGTTTTCEALWMGVPVVTLTGNRHAGRVGASILSRVGLTDLVTDTEDAYLDAAVALSRDIDRCVRLRSVLRERMRKSLSNGAEFIVSVEEAYRRMWHIWCHSRR